MSHRLPRTQRQGDLAATEELSRVALSMVRRLDQFTDLDIWWAARLAFRWAALVLDTGGLEGEGT